MSGREFLISACLGLAREIMYARLIPRTRQALIFEDRTDGRISIHRGYSLMARALRMEDFSQLTFLDSEPGRKENMYTETRPNKNMNVSKKVAPLMRSKGPYLVRGVCSI